MESAIKTTCEIVRDYSRLFVNRGAYTLQSLRPHLESGRHYYFRPKARGTGQELSLTDTTIKGHLEGEITIGLYAINPATQRSKWVAIDADYAGAMEDLLKLQYSLQQDSVESALEMSRRGGHLWIFMERPALARECRIYIYNLALRLGVRIKGAGLVEGIEIFPKHDELAWDSPWCQPAILVLWSGLRFGKTDGLPYPASQGERRTTADLHRWQDPATGV